MLEAGFNKTHPRQYAARRVLVTEPSTEEGSFWLPSTVDLHRGAAPYFVKREVGRPLL